jgi:hypothetical protein
LTNKKETSLFYSMLDHWILKFDEETKFHILTNYAEPSYDADKRAKNMLKIRTQEWLNMRTESETWTVGKRSTVTRNCLNKNYGTI